MYDNDLHCEDVMQVKPQGWPKINVGIWVMPFLAIWDENEYQNLPHAQSWSQILHRFGPVRTHPNRFRKVHSSLNHGPNLAFSSGWSPDFKLNFNQVCISSGSNFGSEPDCGSTRGTQTLQIQWLKPQTFLSLKFCLPKHEAEAPMQFKAIELSTID